MGFKIEKNVPIPVRTRIEDYPLAQMAVGDSFVVPLGNKITACIAGPLRHLAIKLNVKITIRTEGESVRVWRTA